MRLGTLAPLPIDRSMFLRRAGGLLAVAFMDPSGVVRVLHTHHVHRDLEHPDPREGITGEHVLTAEALGKLANKKKVMESYDAAREFPAFFDGVACACSCGGKKGSHRSLLVCFETMQPTGCGACQEEAEVVAKAAREGKTLAEVRAAVDKWSD